MAFNCSPAFGLFYSMPSSGLHALAAIASREAVVGDMLMMQYHDDIRHMPQDYLSKSDAFCRVWVNEKRAHKTQVCVAR